MKSRKMRKPRKTKHHRKPRKTKHHRKPRKTKHHRKPRKTKHHRKPRKTKSKRFRKTRRMRGGEVLTGEEKGKLATNLKANCGCVGEVKDLPADLGKVWGEEANACYITDPALYGGFKLSGEEGHDCKEYIKSHMQNLQDNDLLGKDNNWPYQWMRECNEGNNCPTKGGEKEVEGKVTVVKNIEWIENWINEEKF